MAPAARLGHAIQEGAGDRPEAGVLQHLRAVGVIIFTVPFLSGE
jgi:hypothetical protein